MKNLQEQIIKSCDSVENLKKWISLEDPNVSVLREVREKFIEKGKHLFANLIFEEIRSKEIVKSKVVKPKKKSRKRN